jgi:mRNA interferase MazF
MTISNSSDPKKGEIWLVNFNPVTGAEISKIRPAIVISENSIGKLPLRIVVPITDWKEKYNHFVWFTYLKQTSINGLSKDSGADSFQVKSVSNDRFQRKIGTVTAQELSSVIDAIALCIGI